ncbi:hypothetical protein [Phenylobacterium sp.]|uniref:hypothetical protein n=1 Tax=Phenylobacterium sp. TaxID=1871053 RepID=UPI0028111766|nr:hypothetical protein [Phenylobacterium sp.]
MVSDMDMLEEIDARLAAVADVQFAMIQKINGQVEAASEPAELVQLAEPLDRCARSIRLTYALRVKLRKDIRALARDEERIAEAQAERRVRERDDRIRHRVETLTWREADWEDDDELSAEFDRALEYEGLDPAFATLTLEQQAERIIKRLDLKPEPYPHAKPAPHDTT